MFVRSIKSTTAVLIVICAHHLNAQVRIIKQATDANPRVAIVSFDGGDDVAKRLRDALQRCNWFEVVSEQGKAEYLLRGRHVRGTVESLSVQVSTAAGKLFTVTKTGNSGDTDALVFLAIDDILQKIFKIPGICSSRIAYAVGGKGGKKEIYTCRFDGTGAKRLTHNGNISTEPSWGNDAHILLYTAYGNNATSVVMVDILGKKQRRLSRYPGLNSGADLSPDGRWAALSLSRDDRLELYLLSVSTGRLHRLTQDLAVESSPCWSPDGTRLCYVSDKTGKPRLYIMSARGGKSEPLLSEWIETVSPDWSCVSDRICFATRMGKQYAIAFVDMRDRARQLTVVTKAAGDWEAPSWAPDGRHIVCSRDLNGTRSLYMVDTWHGRFFPLTRGGDHSLPSWSSLVQ